MDLPQGLYDLVVTDAVARALEGVGAGRSEVEDFAAGEDASELLIDALQRQLARVLPDVGGDGGQALAQLELINALLRHIRAQGAGPGGGHNAAHHAEPRADQNTPIDLLASPPRRLRSIHLPGSSPCNHPETGLVTPWLFTAGRGSPSLVNELRREAAAADSIDILVSFITVAGVRKLIDVLRSATAADASGRGRTRIRVLTTTYTGATEIAALDELAHLNGCDVRISLDGRRSRLHAKAWIFRRDTKFGSAYVGSANLSGAALMGGLEWTVKFTEQGQGPLFERAQAHFDTLWLDGEFTPYLPDIPEVRAAVREALRREGGRDGNAGPTLFFDIQPKPFQQEMLDLLAFARERGRNRNLVVAATGTGKTVVAALDYRESVRKLGHAPRLLFIAHRTEILRQALRTYREVLRDHSFGEVLADGAQVGQHEHLFANIGSVTSGQLIERFGADYWHTVVIDECHRIAAPTFDAVVSQIQPAQLLGLTATPERTDGRPIASYFTPGPDGAPAVELRLWHALDMQLLAPFEYYGCDDETDFSNVPWARPGEAAALELAVAGNRRRARLVIDEWTRLSGNPRAGRALVFCVSVAHAHFMTEQFNAAGIPALCITGDTPPLDRKQGPQRLASREVCALVTVDLYNEGVDIPEVDTLLLLRPTQSSLLFQQQLGRGLRLTPGKDSCLVLDFVGQHRVDFRFDRLLSAITGMTRSELTEGVESGFSGLPPGCHIHLQRQTREQVLRSLRTLTYQSWNRLRAELASYSALRGSRRVSLGEFVTDQQIDLDEIYRKARPSGWTTLRRAAGLLGTDVEPASEAELSRQLGWLLHVDDPAQIQLMQRVAEGAGGYRAQSDEERLRLQMLTYQTDGGRGPASAEDFLGRLDASPACRAELGELAAVLETRSRVRAAPVPGLEDAPLQLHGSYGRREILTAVGFHTADSRPMLKTGVLRLQDQRIELMFVTLDKSSGFHAGIAYRDYAMSPRRFHWQTQNAAGPDTSAGRRYLESPANGWRFQLFVRARPGSPFRVCGPAVIADPADVTGDRPLNIEWTLDVPLPGRLFGEFSVLRGG